MAKIVRTEDGNTYEVLDKLGQGGQGIIYKVRNRSDGKYYALKMYLHEMSNDFIKNLKDNIAQGSPDESFIWPLALTEPLGKNGTRRGYVMEMYGKQYSNFVQVVKGTSDFVSKEMQLTALINLVDAFEKLHARGYSYQDLNDGGVLFNTANGDVLVCDNDNVAPYGVNLGIIGKLKYMAPEVHISMFRPDKYSDRFSLALLMFYILCRAHPLDGKKRFAAGMMTTAVQNKIYGTEPVFIFDPNDASNRPAPEDVLPTKLWPTLPPFIQELFIKTFTNGMPSIGRKREDIDIERQNRTSEREWKMALYKWLDGLVPCPRCNNAVCAEVVNDAIVTDRCPHCGKKIKIDLPILSIQRRGKLMRSIVLSDGKVIAKNCVTKERSTDPAFKVKQSKKNKSVYGIVNLLPYKWKCTQTGAKDRTVDTNGVVAALNGVNIEFDYDFSGDITYKL